LWGAPLGAGPELTGSAIVKISVSTFGIAMAACANGSSMYKRWYKRWYEGV
jgi:hypothetical protein